MRLGTKEEQEILDQARGKITLFDFGGPLSFGAAADVGHTVRERVREHSAAIVLDFSRVPFMDVSAARAVETIACDARAAHKTLCITGLNADHCIPGDTAHATRLDALKAAYAEVSGAAGGDPDLKLATASQT